MYRILAIGVVKMEVAHAVQEVRGERVQRFSAHFECHALVGDAAQPFLHQMVEAEMRHKAHPQRGDIGCGVGGHQPAIDGGDDVRVLVREEQVAQLGVAEGREGLHQNLAIDLVPARIEQHAPRHCAR